RALEYMELEWGTYVERFQRLPQVEQEKRVNETGYDSFRDLLAHILAWWEEGMSIILATAEGREFERRKYDFDAFNAEAVARYRTWDETEFITHFEETRQKTAADLKSIDESAFDNRRVKVWLNGIILLHAREHLLSLSRFLTIDLLENEWAEYMENFSRMNAEQQRDFLSKQGFDTFHDLLAHIVGWWEEGMRIIMGIINSPGFTWHGRDVDQFNQELTQKYSFWSDEDLLSHFDTVRLALIDLVADLPDDAFLNNDIEGWLVDDVVEHYDEHALPL
ncbi:MAG TPA: ClbS/DfsB family four-helix bundle protein, partial [Anaerolineales bacterium]|nr:ClbS/DfsB family four-helix bundle protein [Anaerolineales bacterium]